MSDEARNRRFYYGSLPALYVGLLALVATICWMAGIGKTMISFGEIVVPVVLFHFLLSLRSVGEQELGAAILFGKPLFEVTSGFSFVFFGLFKLVKETKLVIADEIPAEPEKIWRKDEVVPENLRAEGFKPPTRIPFAPQTGVDPSILKNGGHDPLLERVTAEVPVILRWRIRNFIRFLTTIGGLKEARGQLEDRTVRFLFEVLPKVTAGEALANFPEYNKRLVELLKEHVYETDPGKSWGVEILSAHLKAINFGHELNVKIQQMAEATAEGRALERKARGEREKRILEGEGSALAEKAVLEARTAGLKTMAEALGVSASVVLGAETARAVTANPGQKTVVVGAKGFSDLVGVATTIGDTLSSESKKTSDEEE